MSQSQPLTGWKLAVSVIAVLVIAAASVAGLFLLLRVAVSTVLRLQSPVASVTVAGLLTLLTSLLLNAWNRYAEAKREEHRRLMEAKRPVYEHLLGVIWDAMQQTRKSRGKGNTVVNEKVVDELAGIVRELIVWGSDDMLRLWGNWMRQASASSSGHEQSPIQALTTMAQLIFAIRKELGYTKTNLTNKELLAMFITDIDTLMD